MDVSQKIEELVAAGMSQALIKEKTGLTESKVSRLKNGVTKNPRFTDATVIYRLHHFVVVSKCDWANFECKETNSKECVG